MRQPSASVALDAVAMDDNASTRCPKAALHAEQENSLRWKGIHVSMHSLHSVLNGDLSNTPGLRHRYTEAGTRQDVGLAYGCTLHMRGPEGPMKLPLLARAFKTSTVQRAQFGFIPDPSRTIPIRLAHLWCHKAPTTRSF